VPDFNLGFPELLTLAVLAVLIFGPDKLPELARKAARVLRYFRGIANDTREQLREEFGDEVADFNPRELNPKTLARKVLTDPVVDDLIALKEGDDGVGLAQPIKVDTEAT
jgi:sec-independent protein translocase protein TatB